ncbi:ADP-forming succinate--CoA ligase subunit beta [Tepidamorphus sp. 3E244]|uniref:ADP-forming succinate--CoA ligase subunit beta n=1 Tax=Tepidamorphus sp. 3E244 TaxID=3385498 RepID=UPI0038FBE51C
MNLSEHLSKEILAQYGVAIPTGRLATSPEEAEARCREIEATKYVVKAQIGAGGRGLSGGVKFAATPSAVRTEAARMIGKRLVTEQTGSAGEMVNSVYVEEAIEIAASYYLSLAFDQHDGQPVLLCSAKGGVEFEQAAQMDPDIVSHLTLPSDGTFDEEAVGAFLEKSGIPANSRDGVIAIAKGAAKAFFANDATLVEINPLAVRKDGSAVAVDAKISLDGNALFRHPEYEDLASDGQLDELERIAQDNDINFVRMSGNIGVVVNGAGLGLATNDMIVDAGGSPANFMDIRTTTTSLQIAKGIGMLLQDDSVRVVLVNVHGGGMTACDTVAEGFAIAYSRAKRKPPVVVRLAGTNAVWALEMLKNRRLEFEAFDEMGEAVERAVEIARTGRV